MRGFPTFTMPSSDWLEVSMLLPGRHPLEVVLRINRELAIEVALPLMARPLLRGAVNLETASWFDLPERQKDWPVSPTGLSMLEARVEMTCKLLRRGYLDPRWLTPRARYEVGL